MERIACVWEHNGADTILWPVEYPGAFARGAGLEEAKGKLPADLRDWAAWTGLAAPEEIEISVWADVRCGLRVCDADSDVLLAKLQEIDALYDEIDALKREAATAKGFPVCEICGSIGEKGDLYCRDCGRQL